MRKFLLASGFLLMASSAAAQDATHVHQPPAAAAWAWRLDGHVFAGFNYQYRKFRDFNAVESQNWLMLTGSGAAGRGRLGLISMFSLEPLTMGGFGSPQVFQTGETYQGAPLIDSQHPHDVVMNLGVRYDRDVGRARLYGGAFPVGEATFGPAVFMHRPSAENNPQVPLGHHLLDSSHITPAVLKGGLGAGPVQVEASWFRGKEPDEDRWDLDLAAPDSWAVRGTVAVKAFSFQVSGGRWHQPEPNEFFDVTKYSASTSFTRATPQGPVTATIAWGRARGFYGVTEAYLAEALLQATPKSAFFTRGEIVDKNILSAGFHGPTAVFNHPHVNSRVGALTLGYLRDVSDTHGLRVGIGGDVTGYMVPPNLEDSYGHPWSFHVFVRVRPAKSAAATSHVH
jgi:hypothetical protein